MKYFTVLYFLCKISFLFSFLIYFIHMDNYTLTSSWYLTIFSIRPIYCENQGCWDNRDGEDWQMSMNCIPTLSHFPPFFYLSHHSLSPSSNLCFSYKIDVTHFSLSSIEINLPFHIHLSLRILSSTMIDWQMTSLTSKESSCPSYSVGLHSAFHHL